MDNISCNLRHTHSSTLSKLGGQGKCRERC